MTSRVDTFSQEFDPRRILSAAGASQEAIDAFLDKLPAVYSAAYAALIQVDDCGESALQAGCDVVGNQLYDAFEQVVKDAGGKVEV